jgi:hypothetical protein
MNRKLIITVDTEGDNFWTQKYHADGIKHITNYNGRYLERFQTICEKYGFVPTYLVDHEMAHSEAFVELMSEALPAKKAEVGMHMHAWNTPPIYRLEPRCFGEYGKPFIGEYPEAIIKDKVNYLTKELQDIFHTKVTSQRSGRWFINSKYINILSNAGYIVDCSVTPGINWFSTRGATAFSHCNDYRKFPTHEYEMKRNNISAIGKSGFYEVPVTIVKKENKNLWLRPDGHNLDDMLYLVNQILKTDSSYLEFMIHSSELMPGGSPLTICESGINKLYFDIESLFSKIQNHYEGSGLSDYVKGRFE